ncbi:NAD kinase [Schaalia vaccimaxillae]|uniref:NAD kinase n=1 Tax=Schaalia vaccimaxillae TaxID=183916 RepID=UPI0003B30F6A|nr:NAD kinase [Schaalia vaccimaxillae]
MVENILVIWNTHRSQAIAAAQTAQREIEKRGLNVILPQDYERADFVLALGGDGTILAAANHARRHDAPLLGVNMGHMGFLAEGNANGIPDIVARIGAEDFKVDSRMTLDVNVQLPGGDTICDWALNEAVVMHTDVAHPVQLAFVVDGQDVSTYGADGIVLATPTGSTAYSFSAGGPVVWPDTEAIVMAPLAAHGLFTRPLVVGPSSTLEIVVLEETWSAPELWCDGARSSELPTASSVEVTVGKRPVRLVRLDDTPFSTRLVNKFNLPVRGWRNVGPAGVAEENR